MSTDLARDFVAAVRDVVGDPAFVPLHVPDIGPVEKELVAECLESTFVSSVGAFVTEFESRIAQYTGAAHAVAVSNGTSALHIALAVAGVRPGDEVIVPTLSFVATANAVVHAGATPHFVDSSLDGLGLDPQALDARLAGMVSDDHGVVNPETGARITAVVPMHTLGHPCDIEAIGSVARRYGLVVVEDAAESLGSAIGGRHTGTFGRTGILSFNGNKILTTGGGGMLLTDDADVAARARSLTTTAKMVHPWEFEHDETAYNYRMPNLNAALGVAQLRRLPEFLELKRELAARYAAVFEHVPGLTFIGEPAGTTSNYWLCAVRLDRPDDDLLTALLSEANGAGLQCRPFWNLLHRQRMYDRNPAGPTRQAESLRSSVICLPSSPQLARFL